ncbi:MULTISPECIES: hypothetical protein [unclassified Archaeoglobus]|jgi:hypothetical protein|uniref:hypothetical protein n=1 Tax=unclassified Archaeoglobus TaxID=2643606 RepID=UPI0025BC2BD4|nr:MULTISPECIES: hypothetical protein [unclassified Archaeoglobus]
MAKRLGIWVAILVVSAIMATIPGMADDGGSAAVMVQETYAGVAVKAITNEHGYMLVDIRTNQTILYFNRTAVNENLHSKPAVTKDEAVKIAEKLCGKAYTLVRVTENPYDYDILFERRINGIPVFGEDCYVVVNRMTGKIAAFRKMPVEDVKVRPMVRISKERALEIVEAEDAKLYIVPKIGVVWITTSGTIVDAMSGKILNERIGWLLGERYRTTVDFGKLGRNIKVKKENSGKMITKGIDDNEGAVFRDDDNVCKDDINAAEESMETPRWNGSPWDEDADNFDVVNSDNKVNDILKDFEAVYYSGHGSKYCIGLGGTGDNSNFCTPDIANSRQTRLFVISACYAGGNTFGERLIEKGVECVIGASGKIYDLLDYCQGWATQFWDRATGNEIAMWQRTAHEARIEANEIMWPELCNLDAEKGNCNIYI